MKPQIDSREVDLEFDREFNQPHDDQPFDDDREESDEYVDEPYCPSCGEQFCEGRCDREDWEQDRWRDEQDYYEPAERYDCDLWNER